jgi:threonine dehydrogenase-like Zn-dependent dehydrogenase
MAASARNAEVYVSDVLDGRLEMAKKFGAVATVNPQKEDISEFTKKVTDGNGFDSCIEACGMPETFLTCIDNAAFGGDIILIGSGKRETTFLHSILLKKELNVFGSRNAYTRDFEDVIAFVKSTEIDLMQMVSAVYPVAQSIEAFKVLEENTGSLLKVLIKF